MPRPATVTVPTRNAKKLPNTPTISEGSHRKPERKLGDNGGTGQSKGKRRLKPPDPKFFQAGGFMLITGDNVEAFGEPEQVSSSSQITGAKSGPKSAGSLRNKSLRAQTATYTKLGAKPKTSSPAAGTPAPKPRVLHSARSGFKHDGDDSQMKLVASKIKQARTSGELNLSACSLRDVPSKIWRINVDPPSDVSVSINISDPKDQWWDQQPLKRLILTSNELTHLSEDIALLSTLTTLDVHDNSLPALPSGVGELRGLERLNASRNKIKSLPNGLFHCKHLTHLYLAHNNLTELDDDVGNLCFLREFDVSHNSISSLPPMISFFTRLSKLCVSHNTIKAIPDEICELPALQSLDAQHNRIHTLPEFIGDLNRLEIINLHHNNLSAFPVLTSCHVLKELHLGDNNIERIDSSHLHLITSIKILDVKDNKITDIPEDVGMLQCLERFDLTNNNLTDLPNQIGSLPNLNSLILEGNPMRKIRRDIVKRGTAAFLKWLRDRDETSSLVTSDNVGIIGKPREMSNRNYINITHTLEYSNHGCDSIPEHIWSDGVDCRAEVVNISKNSLVLVPEEILLLKNSLVDLNVSYNKLTDVTSSLSQCMYLQYINLQYNQLQSLPDSLGDLKGLREINVSSNRFTALPACLYHLSNLNALLSSHNHIHSLEVDGALDQLKSLQVLDVSNNDINLVPPQLGNMRHLRSLSIGGNAFRVPRPATLSKGTSAILEYLRSRITPGDQRS